jgi:hypothetical protein
MLEGRGGDQATGETRRGGHFLTDLSKGLPSLQVCEFLVLEPMIPITHHYQQLNLLMKSGLASK